MLDTSSRLWRAIVWVLRLTVATQCLGNAWWLLRVEESSLLAFLWGAPDVGGLGWSEATSLAVLHTAGWCALLAAVFVVLRPCGWVLLPLTGLQLSIALAMVRMGADFVLPWGWAPTAVAKWFPMLSQSARIVAPLGLWFVDPWRPDPDSMHRRVNSGMSLIRNTMAVTFLAHGIEAGSHFPKFVDFNIMASRSLFGWNITQAFSELSLTIIAVLDIVVALLVASTRSRPAIYYMVLWGFLTAFVRVIIYGWENGFYGFATRGPHFGLPLAIALYWSLQQANSNDISNSDDSSF